MKQTKSNRADSIAIIPARGGSKGVPRKALQLLGDMPLIAYTIRDALNIPGVTKVFVTTDDPEIQAISIAWGAEVPFLRPIELAQDDSHLEDALAYSLGWYRENESFVPSIEIIMSPTHPFRRRNLVNDALAQGLEDEMLFNIGSIAPARVNIRNYHTSEKDGTPFFSDERASEFAKVPLYQSAFSFNIVFGGRPDAPRGRVPVVLNDIEAIDIDMPGDLALARRVVSEGLYPFYE